MEEEEAAAGVNWIELPEHLSLEIMAKLTCFSDYIRFGAVCVQWRSFLFSEYCPKLPRQLPLLIVPTPPSDEKDNDNQEEKTEKKNKKKKRKKKTSTAITTSSRSCCFSPSDEKDNDNQEEKTEKKNKKKKRKKKTSTAITTSSRSSCFYRITDNKGYNQLQLVMPSDRFFRGSGHGWVVTMDNDGLFFRVRLINPFFFPKACKEIELPPLSTFSADPKYPPDPPIPHDIVFSPLYLKKAVLSADPISNPKNYIVMVIYGEYARLAFYKPRRHHKSWTLVNNCKSNYLSLTGLFEDVIYYRGKFYSIRHFGDLVVCDLEKCIAKAIVKPRPSASGDLLMVERRIDPSNDYSTIEFKVFKLLFSDDSTGELLLDFLDHDRITVKEKKPEWVEVHDLRDRALFLGCSNSMSISAFDFPGCKPNCIYYTDHYLEKIHFETEYGTDIGMFSLEDRSIRKHYPTENKKLIWPMPIWIEPPQPQSILKKRSIK